MARREPRLTKRERKAAAAGLTSFAERVRSKAAERGMSDGQVHVGALPDLPKMSDVLKEWAAPMLLPLRGDLRVFRNGVRFAAIVWNAAAAPSGSPEEVARRVMRASGTVGVPLSEEMAELIELLVVQRREEYGDDPRVIIDTEVLDGGNEYRINVASAMPRPDRLARE